MAEEEVNTEVEDDEEETGGKKGLIIIIAVVLLLVGGGAGAYFAGLFGGGEKEETHAEATHKEDDGHAVDPHSPEAQLANMPVYYELPEFLVNLSAVGRQSSFLKMEVTLELRDQEAVPVVDANKPRIVDVFNTYLRELRTSDLAGSAGIYRLREELMARINKTVEPGIVKDILFSEMVVQ